MTPTQLEAFVAVVETGGFTAAAQALSTTQPAVSHAIAALEAELGVLLFERDRKRRTRLTGVGTRLLEHARSSLASLEQIRQEAAAWRGLQAGTLRIGVFASAATHLLPGLLRAYEERYPRVSMVLQDGTDDEVREWIRSRAVDVGFVTLPVERLDAVEVTRDELLAVVPAAHPLAACSEIEPAQLAGEPFILSKGGCEPLIQAVFATVGLAPGVRFAFRDMGTILGMVREGLGVTIAPAMALPAHQPGLVTVPLSPPVMRRLGLAVLSRRKAPPAVVALLEVASALAGTPEASGT